MKAMLRRQNMMLALRQQMGLQLTKPANDSIAFTSGRPVDNEVGMELGRVCGLLGKDLIYSGWHTVRAKDPVGFAVAYRGRWAVDLVEGVLPFAASDNDPVVLVNAQAEEFFAIDVRGSLVRVAGNFGAIGAGQTRAVRRIKAAAANMKGGLLSSNRWMDWGAAFIEPDLTPIETVVRFG